MNEKSLQLVIAVTFWLFGLHLRSHGRTASS